MPYLPSRASSRSKRARPSSVTHYTPLAIDERLEFSPPKSTSNPGCLSGIAPWRNRWIVLTDTELNYFNSNTVRPSLAQPRGWSPPRDPCSLCSRTVPRKLERGHRQCIVVYSAKLTIGTRPYRRLGKKREADSPSVTSPPLKSTPRSAHGGEHAPSLPL